MYIGACRIRLILPESHSLKGKRQIVKSLTQRLRNEFNLSVAEIEENDRWQTAVIGICCVSNSGAHADEMLARAVSFLERISGDAQIADYETEVLAV